MRDQQSVEKITIKSESGERIAEFGSKEVDKNLLLVIAHQFASLINNRTPIDGAVFEAAYVDVGPIYFSQKHRYLAWLKKTNPSAYAAHKQRQIKKPESGAIK